MNYKWMIFSIVFIWAFFLVACMQGVTSTPASESPVAPSLNTDSAAPALLLVEKDKVSINLPDIYIIVDDSSSMTREDNAGQACDPYGTRYKLAYFLWKTINDWKLEGIIESSQQTFVWFLDGNNGNSKFHNISSDPQNELLSRIESGDSFSGLYHEFYLLFSNQVLEREIPENSIIVFITDGDFRSSRDKKNIQNDTWENLKEEIATGVQNLKNNRGVETYFLLLCPRRLDDANLDEVKDLDMLDEWAATLPNHSAHVYGLDKDASNVPVLPQRDFSEKIFEEISRFLMDFRNLYAFPEEIVWTVVDRNGHGSYIDANTLYFYADGTSYETQPSQKAPYSFEIRLDGDLAFPEILNPLDGQECNQHYFTISGVEDLALIWYRKQLLSFYLENIKPIIFYNDQPDELNIYVPGGIDWARWKSCLATEIQLSDGTMLVSSFEDDLSGGHILKIYSPQNGDTFQEYNLDLIFSWTNSAKEIQTIPLQYIRVYSPEYLYPANNLGDNTIGLNYKYLNKLGSTDYYQPTLFFSDTGCSLFYPNKYKPSGSPYQQGVSITVEKERYLISFFNNATNFQNCKEMQVQWYDWPDQYSKYKPKIVSCDLSWDDSGHFLNSVECK